MSNVVLRAARPIPDFKHKMTGKQKLS